MTPNNKFKSRNSLMELGSTVGLFVGLNGDLNGSSPRQWQRKATLNKTDGEARPLGHLNSKLVTFL
jgi:hypothetical protein